MSDPPGPFPVRTDITVLGPDDPKQKPIGFSMTERDGVEVYKLDDDFRCGVARNTIGPDDLKVGMEVVIPSVMGGYHGMVIVEHEGKLQARGGGWAGVLQVAEDDRKTWVCVAMVNLRGVKMTGD